MDKLREAMKARGMSAYRLSQLSGVAQSTISRLLSGEIQPENARLGTLHRLASALGVGIGEIIDEDKLNGD